MTEASGIKSKLSTTIYFSCIWGPFTPWRGYGQSTFDSREIPFCFAFAAFFLILKQKLEKIPTYWKKSRRNWKKSREIGKNAANWKKCRKIGKKAAIAERDPSEVKKNPARSVATTPNVESTLTLTLLRRP